MISFARTIVLLALTPALLGAQPESQQPESGLAERVAGSIAEQWQIAPERVRLKWGRGAEALSVTGETEFRVLGKGSDGSFAVIFDHPNGEALALRVRAGVQDTVMVAARPIDAGCLIGEADLRPEVRLTWGSPRADRGGLPGPGWEARRRLEAGEAATWPAVLPPPLVTAGEPVRLEWVRGAVMISLTGLALNSARRGQTVQARVSGRLGRLSGMATAPGTAVLVMGVAR